MACLKGVSPAKAGQRAVGDAPLSPESLPEVTPELTEKVSLALSTLAEAIIFVGESIQKAWDAFSKDPISRLCKELGPMGFVFLVADKDVDDADREKFFRGIARFKAARDAGNIDDVSLALVSILSCVKDRNALLEAAEAGAQQQKEDGIEARRKGRQDPIIKLREKLTELRGGNFPAPNPFTETGYWLPQILDWAKKHPEKKIRNHFKNYAVDSLAKQIDKAFNQIIDPRLGRHT